MDLNPSYVKVIHVDLTRKERIRLWIQTRRWVRSLIGFIIFIMIVAAVLYGIYLIAPNDEQASGIRWTKWILVPLFGILLTKISSRIRSA